MNPRLKPTSSGCHNDGVADEMYRERRPAAELGRLVACVSVQQVFPGSEPFTHRPVPNGSAELLCEVGAMPRVVGPQTRPLEHTLMPGRTVVGVRFKPGAAPSLLGVPASELVNLQVGADELWGRSAVALGEAVAAAASPWEAAAKLEAAIAGRLAGAAEPDPVALEAVRLLLPGRTRDVTSLPSELYISESQLRRRLRDATGFAPKLLHRMLRFQGFLALAQGYEHPSRELARLATDAGYADQSHLTRESARLAGLSPQTLLRNSERYCGPTHDHAAYYGPLLPVRRLAHG
jgi:AraC-like DNA-binding protein